MSAPKIRIAILLFTVGGILFACTRSRSTPPPAAPSLQAYLADAGVGEFSADVLEAVLALSPLPSKPPDPTNRYADHPKAAELGRALFFDKSLSANGAVACATCHDPDRGFSDGRARMHGVGDGPRHSPPIWNTAYQRWFFWDGRADTAWSQAQKPIESEVEMALPRAEYVRRVLNDSRYADEYRAVFGAFDPVLASGKASAALIDRAFANLTKAIAAYERLLSADDSAFDRFVAALKRRDPDGIRDYPAAARRGLAYFTTTGQCTLCHTGPLFTDGEFHNIGLKIGTDLPLDLGRHPGIEKVLADPMNGRGTFSDAAADDPVNDRLRYVVQKDNNFGEFKSPSLRGVADRAPYMHDGRFASLKEVLDFYSELPDRPALGHREESLKPLHLTENEKSDLIAFLNSLSPPRLPDHLRAAR